MWTLLGAVVEALLSNTYTMVFAGTIVVGVMMLAISLAAFLVLSATGFGIHGLVILSRKAITPFLPQAILNSNQPPAADGSVDSTAGGARGATVHIRETTTFASVTDPETTTQNRASPRFARRFGLIREEVGPRVDVMPAGRHFKRETV